jgi:hypothetical protein
VTDQSSAIVANRGVAGTLNALQERKVATKGDKSKCNAGNGDGSESTVTTDHCIGGDPGSSFAAGNRGGDETDFPRSAENPGRNNAPQRRAADQRGSKAHRAFLPCRPIRRAARPPAAAAPGGESAGGLLAARLVDRLARRVALRPRVVRALTAATRPEVGVREGGGGRERSQHTHRGEEYGDALFHARPPTN